MSQKAHLQLPRELSEFMAKTYVLCLSHSHAKVFRIYNNLLEQKDDIVSEGADFTYSDKEGASRGTGNHMSTTGDSKHNKEHYEKAFLTYLMNTLSQLDQKDEYAHLYMFIPEDIKNVTANKLPLDLKKKTKIFPGNRCKDHPLDLVKLILSNRDVNDTQLF